ncbi:MAG: beta-propeller fold lactonase family protein [Capsulimonadaceae bacterium]
MGKLVQSRAFRAVLLATTLLATPRFALAYDFATAQNDGADDESDRAARLPTGQLITPTAPEGAVQQYLNPGLANYPNFVANEAVRASVSPDGKLLAILCAGFNSNRDKTGNFDPAASNQYIFLYDIAGANSRKPILKQVIQQTNAYVGLVWSADGKTLYAAGGNDDAVYAYAQTGGIWTQSAKIGLGHNRTGIGRGIEPNAAGIALSADGKTLVAANNFNDSISVIDTGSRRVRYEFDLRPYVQGQDGVPGGEYPFAVVIKGNDTAYVSANRDREIVAVDISSASAGKLIKRIPVDGLPNGMALNAPQTRLYVAQDNADQVAVIDTASNTVVRKIDARGPEELLTGPHYTGAAPYAVELSADGKTLYAVNDGANSVAVIPLTGPSAEKTVGLIPTAYAPKDIAFSKDGKWMYIINGKSDQGPNPLTLYGNTNLLTTVTYPGGNLAALIAAAAANQYQLNNDRSTLVSARVPESEELERLTGRVARNNFYSAPRNSQDEQVMSFLRSKIKHVIYIIKENRTFDQVLGDLKNGAETDPKLAVFGKAITPNQHRIASDFVTLDHFLDTGDASMDGWGWSLQGRATSTLSLTQNINYAGPDRGLSYDSEGANRNVPTGLTVPQRIGIFGSAYSDSVGTPPGGVNNVLPGTHDVAASDAPSGAGKGYIFDAVTAAGGTLRNYGMLTVNVGAITAGGQPITNAGAAGVLQVVPLQLDVVQPGITDVYFRGYDNAYPDTYRFNEWNREFQNYVSAGNLPTMELVRFNHDHTGSFGNEVAGLNTPETQVADNDLAVGRLVETVSKSRYANSTLIFVVEDDSQDGPDHIDSHRAPAYVVGAYVKKRSVIGAHYTTVNLLRTIEDVLGLPHLNLNTAYQRPMTEIFDIGSSGAWSFDAVASTILKGTKIARSEEGGIEYAEGPDVLPTHDVAYWVEKTRGFDFSDADLVPPALYNKVLWEGLRPGEPYPK